MEHAAEKSSGSTSPRDFVQVYERILETGEGTAKKTVGVV